MHVFEQAKGIMRADGNLNQWAGDYPSLAAVEADIECQGSFVVEDDGIVVAYFACLPSPELTYAEIFDGAWLEDSKPYHVIHRIGSLPQVHGIFRSIIDFCIERDPNIRIDTHRDNKIMQHLLLHNGFAYCGIIYLASGDERLAYQRKP